MGGGEEEGNSTPDAHRSATRAFEPASEIKRVHRGVADLIISMKGTDKKR